LFRALDTDHDGQLSREEMIAAPAVLLAFDQNGDGKLSAVECGANLGDVSRLSPSQLRAACMRFMRSSPLLSAFDADHDGEISAREIRNAEQELMQLDRNHDGALQTTEILPPYVIAVAHRFLAQLDRNPKGRIEPNECHGDPFRDLLAAADTDQGATLDVLADEIFYRADRNKDGIVTDEEWRAAIRSGMLGPVTEWVDQPRSTPH
jgi:EF hand